MENIRRTVYTKEGRAWRETYSTTDEAEVYRSLAGDLEARYMAQARYIRRVERRNNYDGTETFSVYYDNAVKSIYRVRT
jgi:hypothetical protein